MIVSNLETARVVLSNVLALNPWLGADPETAALCEDVTQTIVAEHFPGGLVPCIDTAGNMKILVAAPTMAAWRRLKPVLLAFAGPTLTGFYGVPGPISPGDRVADCLKASGPAVTAVIRMPTENRLRVAALRGIRRARDTLERAPELQRSAPVPTSWLLARFQDCLNVGRRDVAAEVLERLHSEMRLDALNIMFLQVQFLATFRDWTAIVTLPGFASLCNARRTPAVTALILEALYQTHISRPFEAENVEETRQIFEASVQPFTQSMLLTAVATQSFSIGGCRILGLEALTNPGRDDLLTALADRQNDLGWIAGLLPVKRRVESQTTEVAAPLDDARRALIRADVVDSIDLLAHARAALSRLDPSELALLRESMPFGPIVESTDDLTKAAPPRSWASWLERAAEPAFTDALEVARQGKDEWEIGSATADPVTLRTLVDVLNRVPTNELATARATQALPYLVAWLQRDSGFPRAALSAVYSALLTLFALGSARGATVYESSQVLIEALLATGLDQKAYRDLVADVEEIAGGGFGADMIYWLLEIVESFQNSAAPDPVAREAFLHSILARVIPIRSRLTRLQRTAITLLGSDLGWTLPALSAPEEAHADDRLATRLAGMRIAIYSLTETSSRQAKIALEKITPAVIVDTSADHGGSPRLRALAENADLFVMTWLSAKHAATDFIRDHRGDRQLIYARGKGFSSILRAIEEFFSSTSDRPRPA